MFGKLIKITNNTVITFLMASQKPVFWDTISNLFLLGMPGFLCRLKGQFLYFLWHSLGSRFCGRLFFGGMNFLLMDFLHPSTTAQILLWLGAASFNMTQRSKIVSQNKRFSSASVSECHISFYCIYILLS